VLAAAGVVCGTVMFHGQRDWRPSEGKVNAYLPDVTGPRIESARVADNLDGVWCVTELCHAGPDLVDLCAPS
jgi:hypothetical protein